MKHVLIAALLISVYFLLEALQFGVIAAAGVLGIKFIAAKA